MTYIEGKKRTQMFITSLDDMVDKESPARVIDRFIDTSDLYSMGFTRTVSPDKGRPGYAADILVKLYLYGYTFGIRSSRELEKATRCNVEVMWLTGSLSPDHKTISEFRRLNTLPLEEVFKEFVLLCQSWDLIKGDLMVLDGTKVKASNNRKANFSRKKLKKNIAHIDDKINQYLSEAEETDQAEDKDEDSDLSMRLEELASRKELYESYLEQLDESGEGEISVTDPDARMMGNNRGGLDMAYNVQSVVDGKYHIITDFDVINNPTDQGCLSEMTKHLIKLGYHGFTILADKGYYNGEDLEELENLNVCAIVARQAPPTPKDKPEEYRTDRFVYDAKTDSYTCPEGQILGCVSKEKTEQRKYLNRSACRACSKSAACISANSDHRVLIRGPYADIYDRADERYSENRELYKLRQQIVEHPFGTIKRAMGGVGLLLRTLPKVRCECALLLLGYNLKRAINALGFQGIMDKLDALAGDKNHPGGLLHALLTAILLPKKLFGLFLGHLSGEATFFASDDISITRGLRVA